MATGFAVKKPAGKNTMLLQLHDSLGGSFKLTLTAKPHDAIGQLNTDDPRGTLARQHDDT